MRGPKMTINGHTIACKDGGSPPGPPRPLPGVPIEVFEAALQVQDYLRADEQNFIPGLKLAPRYWFEKKAWRARVETSMARLVADLDLSSG